MNPGNKIAALERRIVALENKIENLARSLEGVNRLLTNGQVPIEQVEYGAQRVASGRARIVE